MGIHNQTGRDVQWHQGQQEKISTCGFELFVGNIGNQLFREKGSPLSITECSAEGRILYANSAKGLLPGWKMIPQESVDESLYQTVCK
jgi:hypothetical protein